MTKTLDGTLLGVYLNDHLAGATAGVALARRLAGENRNTIHADALRRLAGEIAEDRTALLDTMAAVDVPVRHYKTWLAWAAEKAGRLKPNGRLFIRSPLSRVIGLELMTLGVEGKAAGWHTLRTRAATDSRLDPARFGELIERAQQQATELEGLRRWAVAGAFGGEAPDPTPG
ncbi:MAG TPA: hypothetical protein VGP26_30545 [Actinophytocola sp.]|jgi:hypothetical protein|nr:hypothetical protein [Actinophytocola sp.]